MVTVLSDWVAYTKTKGKYLFAAVAVAVVSLGSVLTATAAPAVGAVRINEVYASPTSGNPEWVELRNMTGAAIDLSGWTLTDGASTPNEFGDLEGVILPPNGYKAVESVVSSSILNNSGDSLTLKSGTTTIDTVTFGVLTSSQVFVRYQNCVGTTGVEVGSTKGTVNPTKAVKVMNQNKATCHDDLAVAVVAATASDTLSLVDDLTITATVVVNKALTIKDGANVTVKTNGSNSVLRITAPGVTVRDLTFVKTDKTSQNMVQVLANNATISTNVFAGQYMFGDAHVDRALEVGSVAGLTIASNYFSNLRQPAYINAATGTVENNYANGTRGWVAVSESNITFSGNSWGNNALDIAIIKNTPVGANNYTNIAAISYANNDALIENQLYAPAVLSDVYVDDDAAVGGNGSKQQPYQTIQQAMPRVAENGTIHVANGTYNENLVFEHNGVQLLGESKNGVIVKTTGTAAYGVEITAKNNTFIHNITFLVGSSIGSLKYHLKAYNGSGLLLDNVVFTGAGSATMPRVGGIDINSFENAALSNVVASEYSKNGVAFTAQYAAEDVVTTNVGLLDVTTQNNAWAGLAFYASNASGTIGRDITNVTFTGNNHFLDNGAGIFIQGDSDANFQAGNIPRWNVLGTGSELDFGTTVFAGNGKHIQNYQPNDVIALKATFDGKTGNQMTQNERDLFDLNNDLGFGNIIYYDQPAVDAATPGRGGSDISAATVAASTTSHNTYIPYYQSTHANDTRTLGETTPSETKDAPKEESANKGSQLFGLDWFWWCIILVVASALGAIGYRYFQQNYKEA